MKLIKIDTLRATIKLLSGLHIGGGDAAMKIGGIDNEVIKDAVTGIPYIPGSSLKGKIRSLLEWKTGLVGYCEGKPAYLQAFGNEVDQLLRKRAVKIISLFGNGKPFSDQEKDMASEIGITRTSFNDCYLSKDNPKYINEIKFENTINRISSKAENPRQMERIPSGYEFDFELNLKVFSDDTQLDNLLLEGLKLLELDALGGSGSRGYGKIKFINMMLNGTDIQAQFDAISPFSE